MAPKHRGPPKGALTTSGVAKSVVPKQRSWLPAEFLTPKQIGLCIFVIAVVLAGVVDTYRNATFDPKVQGDAYLDALYEIGQTLPSERQPPATQFKTAAELNAVASVAQESVAVLEDVDTMQYPHVAKAAVVVLTKAIEALKGFVPNAAADAVSIVRLCMALSDVALHTDADQEHVSLLILGARAERWNAAWTPPDAVSQREMSELRAAAFVEQAVAVIAESPDLRVMYASALLDSSKFDSARAQVERVLRKHPQYKHRKWAEWIDAVATKNGRSGDHDADVAQHALQADLDPAKVPVIEFAAGIKAPLVEATTLKRYFIEV